MAEHKQEPSYSCNLFIVLKDTVVDAYNHIGYLLFSSVLWLLAVVPFGTFVYLTLQIELEMEEGPLSTFFKLLVDLRPELMPTFFLLSLCIFCILLYFVLVIAPINSALLAQAYKVSEGWGSLRGFWTGLCRNYRQTVGVYLLYGIAFSLLVVNIVICFFFLAPFFSKIVGILNLYLLLFLVLAGFHLPSLIVLQENSVKKVFKKAFLLVLANGPLTLLAVIILLLIGLLFSFLLPLLVMAYGGILQFFTLRVFLGLLEKYEAKSTVRPESG